MSVLQYPQGINPKDVQIWNNAAFDNGDSQDLKSSWSPLKPILFDQSDSFDSDISSKENQAPSFENSSVNLSSPLLIKPLNQNGAVEKSRIKPNKSIFKQSVENDLRDVKMIDEEIEEIEMEISRLNSRLEELRMEKVEKSVVVKTVEKKGRVVAAKFMEPKQSVEKKKIEESSSMSARIKGLQRRGLSLGPSEIFAGSRRGLSLGPSEIFAGTKAGKLGKQELNITPIQPIQNRRKSCFWKLQEIEEESLSKERGKSSSVSPKSRKAAARTTMTSSRQAVTTIASKKNLKKDDVFLSSVQPKKLFKDSEKSAAANKKPQRPGRVVASRYNQSTTQSTVARKRSFESDKDESKRNEKKRSLSVGKTRVSQTDNKNLGTESRVKKRWEIPNEIVVHGSTESEKSPLSITVKPDLLPRIRIARCPSETPRDSGPAKRVAELIGKKSFFSSDEDKEPSVCQVLSFAEEDASEEE